MREQLRVGSALSWAAAWLLAIAGPVLVLVSPSVATYWIGGALVVPLLGLAAWREDRKGMQSDLPLGEGPYSPPPGL